MGTTSRNLAERGWERIGAARSFHNLRARLSAFRDADPHDMERRLPDYESWCRAASPSFSWHWDYLRLIDRELAGVTRGEVRKLMIFIPFRHGKSEKVTIRYPVYRLEGDPTLPVIIGCYNQTLANRFSRRARKIAQSLGPERLPLSKERSAAEEWETALGGGIRAAGVGAGITGMGGKLIMIDDPIKNRKEANSKAYRDAVWEWYTNDLYTRLEPGGSIVLIMTRWHEDDLAGRILASEDGPNWRVIRAPAIAETQAARDDAHERMHLEKGLPDPLGRMPGEALCPDRFTVSDLRTMASVLGDDWNALGQQDPRPGDGAMFPRKQFTLTDDAPPIIARRVRYWDKASSEEERADFTVGTLLAIAPNGSVWIEDVVRVKQQMEKREETIARVALRDKLKYGGAVVTWIEQEGGSGGKDSAEITVKRLTVGLYGKPGLGVKAKADKKITDKVSHASAFSEHVREFGVFVCRAPWNREFLGEMTAFPSALHDDIVDSASGAYNKAALMPFPGQAIGGGSRPGINDAIKAIR